MSDVLVDKKAWVKAEVITIATIMGLLLAVCLVLPIATQNVTSTWYKNYNQYPIGIVVNISLIYSGLRLRKLYNVIGIVLLPSICAATLGLIGINAVSLLYMVPFIWLGNMTIVLSFRFLFRNGKIKIDLMNKKSVRYVIASVLGIGLKVSIIFLGFLILRSLGAFPTLIAEKLYTMMGIVQLITATSGAIIAFGMIKLTRQKYQ